MSEDTYYGEKNDPLSLNRYLYCSGNPVLFVDPSGHIPTVGEAVVLTEDVYKADLKRVMRLEGRWYLYDV